MVRKLILSDSGFPEKFNSSSISPPSGISKQQYIENQIIEKINNYNPKLKVSNIEYLKIVEQFPHLDFFEMYFGLIVEEFEINELKKDLYKDVEYYIWENGGKYFCRKILIYLIMSVPEEKARNIFVSQCLFPEAIDFMNYYKDSPCFSIANHPIYYINYVDKELTAPMIIKNIAGMIELGIENIEIFYEINELKSIPKNIKDFLNKYYKDFDETSILYKNDYCEIDINNKITIIKTDRLVLGDLLKYKSDNITYDFKDGSVEKFYWMCILPIIIISLRNSFTLDYSKLEDFYNLNNPLFSSNSEKMERFLFLINYIKKLTKGVK